jgi:hypothetical protein
MADDGGDALGLCLGSGEVNCLDPLYANHGLAMVQLSRLGRNGLVLLY